MIINKISVFIAFVLIKTGVLITDGKPPKMDEYGKRSYNTKGLRKYNPLSYFVLAITFFIMIIVAPFEAIYNHTNRLIRLLK